MKHVGESAGKYREELARRGKQSGARRSYQFAGLEIAVLLKDFQHRGLYIKLAKERDPDYLIQLAKSVAEKKDVKNRGAYFMKLLAERLRKR